MFCLQNTNYELCRSHLKKNVLLKFLGKKRDGNEFVPNFGKRNGLLVRLTIFYGKSTKLVQLSEKSAVDAHGLFERNGIYRVQMTSYAVKRTILVPASPRKIQKVTGISRAFYHCVSSITVVLWQKVNLTNNHLIFQNKIGVILCENN